MIVPQDYKADDEKDGTMGRQMTMVIDSKQQRGDVDETILDETMERQMTLAIVLKQRRGDVDKTVLDETMGRVVREMTMGIDFKQRGVHP